MPSGNKDIKYKGKASQFNSEIAVEMQKRAAAKRKENKAKREQEKTLREAAQEQVKKIIKEYLPNAIQLATAKDLVAVLDRLTSLFGVPEDENRTIANRVIVEYEDASGTEDAVEDTGADNG